MAYFIELNLPMLNSGEEIVNSQTDSICVCCLARNVPCINLANCKHKEYLETFYKFKAEWPSLVCHVCHEMLRKIELFKVQVQTSALILNKKISNMKILKVHDLQSATNILLDIPPEDDYVTTKEEPLTAKTDIKEESDISDFETEMPLSVIKEQKESKEAVKKQITLIKIKKEHLTDTSRFPDSKYVGKLKMHLLTPEQLEIEREMMRTEERYQKLPYKCESCIIGFNKEMYLRSHNRQRHRPDLTKYICEICKSAFTMEVALKPHQRRHFIRYDCIECGKRYIDERAIVTHYNEKHSKAGAIVQNKFKCNLEECTYETHSYRSFMNHRSQHERYPCTKCEKVFTKWQNLRAHVYGVHNQKQTTFPCDKCDKVYKQRCGLRFHIQSAHTVVDRLPYCDPCRMHFKTVNNLKQHLRQHRNHITDAEKKYMCDNCGMRFVTKSNLKAHIQWVHFRKSDFICPHCLKVCRTKYMLKKHVTVVHEKKQLPRDKICDYCGKGFMHAMTLKTHIYSHTGERPLQCTRCPATFAHKGALYTHNRLIHKVPKKNKD